MEDQVWNARERTIIARTKQYLEGSYRVKVEVEELEDLLGPDDVDVDFRRILLGTDGPSKFVVVSRSRWDKHQRKWKRTLEDTIRRPLQVMDGGKRAWNSRVWLELGGTKGYGGSGRLPGELRQHESGH